MYIRCINLYTRRYYTKLLIDFELFGHVEGTIENKINNLY